MLGSAAAAGNCSVRLLCGRQLVQALAAQERISASAGFSGRTADVQQVQTRWHGSAGKRGSLQAVKARGCPVCSALQRLSKRRWLVHTCCTKSDYSKAVCRYLPLFADLCRGALCSATACWPLGTAQPGAARAGGAAAGAARGSRGSWGRDRQATDAGPGWLLYRAATLRGG